MGIRLCCVLGGSEGLGGSLYVFHVSGRLSGGSVSNEPVVAGGSAKERPSRAWGEGGGGGGRLDLSCFTRV